MNEKFALTLVKFLIAIIIGAFLGIKFLFRGFDSGEIFPFLQFALYCIIFGFILSKIDV